MDHQVCLISVQLRYLAQRELTLQKKRLAVEETIRKHKALLKKDRELDKEEASVNKLVDQAMEMLRQTPLSSSRHGHSIHREPSPPILHYSLSEKPSGGSLTEELSSTESIAEKMSKSSVNEQNETEIPSEYATDTFESTLTASHPPQPITASTPSHQSHFLHERQSEMDDKATESIAGEPIAIADITYFDSKFCILKPLFTLPLPLSLC